MHTALASTSKQQGNAAGGAPQPAAELRAGTPAPAGLTTPWRCTGACWSGRPASVVCERQRRGRMRRLAGRLEGCCRTWPARPLDGQAAAAGSLARSLARLARTWTVPAGAPRRSSRPTAHLVEAHDVGVPAQLPVVEHLPLHVDIHLLAQRGGVSERGNRRAPTDRVAQGHTGLRRKLRQHPARQPGATWAAPALQAPLWRRPLSCASTSTQPRRRPHAAAAPGRSRRGPAARRDKALRRRRRSPRCRAR